MAARENQGLQIALIIFVMLTIVLIVTTYLFFSSYQEEKERNKTLAADNANKDKSARDAIAESEAFKNLLGAAQTEKIDAVQERAKKDMESYGKGIPEASQNYYFLVEHLANELKKYKDSVAELTTRAKDLDDKLKANDEATKAEIAKYTEKLAATAADLEKERKTFQADRDEITKAREELTQRFDASRREHEEQSKQSTDQIASLTTERAKLTDVLKHKNEEELRKIKANEKADGKVTWVNQRTRVVWINVGSDDNLRRQTSFSIFDASDANPVESKSKGKIQVTRLMDRHLAEARIVEDNLSDPIMPGDQIFSITWEPGRAEHFALAGLMDIDNDGQSDRQRIRDLIALNGGVVDAEVADDGKRSGQMSINTKYLVLGSEPSDEARIAAYSQIRGEAQTLGVKTMSVAEFLDYMGFKAEDRTVNLGRNARPGDFKARFPEGVQRTVPGSAPPKDLRKPPVIPNAREGAYQ